MNLNLKNQINKHLDKLRFGLIGVINTVIDFGILFSLTHFGFGNIASNFLSTSVALTFSFFANKNFTFRDKSQDKLQFLRFLSVTLFGLWIIQPLILWITNISLSQIIINDKIILLIGKLLATCITLIWNFILYKIFVYKVEK